MKFCPNCGNVLDGKEICDCGYNTITNEVDEAIYEEFKSREKSNYEMSCNMMGMNINMINVDENNQPIVFNKDNDNLKSEDILKIMNEYYKDEEE